MIVAMHRAYVTRADSATAMRLLREYGGSPLGYRDNGRAMRLAMAGQHFVETTSCGA